MCLCPQLAIIYKRILWLWWMLRLSIVKQNVWLGQSSQADISDSVNECVHPEQVCPTLFLRPKLVPIPCRSFDWHWLSSWDWPSSLICKPLQLKSDNSSQDTHFPNDWLSIWIKTAVLTSTHQKDNSTTKPCLFCKDIDYLPLHSLTGSR